MIWLSNGACGSTLIAAQRSTSSIISITASPFLVWRPPLIFNKSGVGCQHDIEPKSAGIGFGMCRRGESCQRGAAPDTISGSGWSVKRHCQSDGSQHCWVRQLEEIGDKILASRSVIWDGKIASNPSVRIVYSHHIATSWHLSAASDSVCINCRKWAFCSHTPSSACAALSYSRQRIAAVTW